MCTRPLFRTSPTLAAFTLLEVIIATLLLAVFIGLTLQAILTSKRFEASAAVQDSLAESNDTLRTILNDEISQSGWHIPDGTTTAAYGSTPAENALESSGSDNGRLTSDISKDRTRRYYPYVIGVHPSGASDDISKGLAVDGSTVVIRHNVDDKTGFPHAVLAPSLVLDYARIKSELISSTAPTQDYTGPDMAQAAKWYGSYSAPSQSLIFLRAFTYLGSDGALFDDSIDPAKVIDSAMQKKYEAALSISRASNSNWRTTSAGEDHVKDLSIWRGLTNHGEARTRFPSPFYEDPITKQWKLRPDVANDPASWRSGSVPPNVDDILAQQDLLPYGIPLESAYVVSNTADGTIVLQPQWETMKVPNHIKPGSGDPAAAKDHLKPTYYDEDFDGNKMINYSYEDVWREYVWTVVRSPNTQRYGRLVRARKALRLSTPRPVGAELGMSITDPASPGLYEFVIDRIPTGADNVVRVTFDTHRTDRMHKTDIGRLDVNQIKVRLYIARPDLVSGQASAQVVSFTITMRSKNTEAQRADDALLLGVRADGANRPGYPR